jgi:hypothetical protein
VSSPLSVAQGLFYHTGLAWLVMTANMVVSLQDDLAWPHGWLVNVWGQPQ